MSKNIVEIRLARSSEAELLVGLHDVTQRSTDRQHIIEKAIDGENCFVAVLDTYPVGYGILEYTFYDNGFISMLMVDAAQRRKGVGASLMAEMESACQTPKLFTSTNLSNLPMQSLLVKLGYEPSGVIHNLDPGDPELVYFRLVGAIQS